MQRPAPWFMLVILLLGLLLLREPRFVQTEDFFLRWLLEHAQAPSGDPVPLTVVEIGQDALTEPGTPPPVKTESGSAISPLEFALFLQSILDFQPGVIAFENVLKWRERDKDQEQIFLDQAMRAPKLLLAAELGDTADPDANWGDIRGFPNVVGRRGDLTPFSGIARQPNEDLRLVSTQGFSNLPDAPSSAIRIPLLFLYRGEVIPSFPLQAILLWLKTTPAETEIVLGSHIQLPQNRRIPIAADGTLLIDPNAGKRARHMNLNELLVTAQQRESAPEASKETMANQIVLARTPDNPLSPPDRFAATIATIQGNHYLRRISPIFDVVMLILIGAATTTLRRIERFDLVLYGIAFTAAYCLIALGAMSRWGIWVPGLLPLGAVWLVVLVGFFSREKREATNEIPPPVA